MENTNSNEVQRTSLELYDELCMQTEFLKSDCSFFDEGKKHFAKKIATTLRILFHDTRNSSSLLTQISKSFFYRLPDFISLADIEYKENEPTKFLRCSLIYYKPDPYSGVEPILKAFPSQYDPNKRYKHKSIKTWWERQIVIFIDSNIHFARKDVIRLIADKVGGTHIDPTIPEYLSDILNNKTKHISIKTNLSDKTPIIYNAQPEDILFTCVRAIAEETLIMLENIILPYCKSHLYI